MVVPVAGWDDSLPIDGILKMSGSTEPATWGIVAVSMIQRILAAAALILAGPIAGCTSMSPSQSDIAMGGDEVSKRITGNTFRGAWEGKQLIMVYYQDGTVRGSLGLSGSDSGTWTVENNVYCHHWTRFFGSTRRCYKWWKRESDYLLQNVDAYRIPNLRGTMAPGKPSGY